MRHAATSRSGEIARRLRHRRGQQEVGPVIVHRARRHVGIARRQGELPELVGERAVPDEVRREVGAVVSRAVLVRATEVPVRRAHYGGHEQEHQQQRVCIRARPGGHIDRRPRSHHPRERERQCAQRRPRDDRGDTGSEARYDRDPQRELRQAVAEQRAADPSGGMAASEQRRTRAADQAASRVRRAEGRAGRPRPPRSRAPSPGTRRTHRRAPGTCFSEQTRGEWNSIRRGRGIIWPCLPPVESAPRR